MATRARDLTVIAGGLGGTAEPRMPHFTPLVRDLLSFQAQLTVLRDRVEAEARTPDAAEANTDGGARVVVDRLEEILRSQWELARRRSSDRELAMLREAQYVMSALADDLFLHDVEWKGRAAWSADLLEGRMFGTRVAGEKLFENATRIAQARDRSETGLAPVYLLALGLGFKGRYRRPDGHGPLEAHARALSEVAPGRPADPALGGRPLVPGAVSNVVAGIGQRRTWSFVAWPAVAGGIAAAFVVVSSIVWFNMTGDLSAAADAVIQAAR
ncbi:MAG: DotU family type IV/VI secretion system protein [Rhodospirillales bacterium]